MGSGRVVLAAVLVGLCFAMSPGQAHALSCGLPRPAYVELIDTEVVFVGIVRSFSLLREVEDYHVYEAEFDVLQVWKGNLPDVARLRTAFDPRNRGCDVADQPRRFTDEPLLIYSDGEHFAHSDKVSRYVSLARGDLLQIAAVFVVLTALPSTVLLLTLSKALRSYHNRFLAGSAGRGARVSGNPVVLPRPEPRDGAGTP